MHKRGAHEKQQILSKSQEATLVQWIGYQAAVAKPLDRDDIASLVFDISGIAPGTNWIYHFEQCHPEIHMSRPGNLDPKRAQNFNPTNIAYFYKLLKDVYDAFPNLPPEHVWNMDEKCNAPSVADGPTWTCGVYQGNDEGSGVLDSCRGQRPTT